MAIIPARERPRPVLDLRGPDGNAFAIMGTARRIAKQLGEDPDVVMAEMMALSDYTKIIEYFESHYGAFVDIILPENISPRDVSPPQDLQF